jgi:GTPase SAR1 family protein
MRVPKCLIIGDRGCGKTTFMRRCAGLPLDDDYIHTHLVEVHPIAVNVRFRRQCVNCWEISDEIIDDNAHQISDTTFAIYIHTADKPFDNKWIERFNLPRNCPVVHCINVRELRSLSPPSDVLAFDMLHDPVECLFDVWRDEKIRRFVI